ncbi:hypothetical protein B0H19DRAFT_1268938 [Mycena capillaripes]|nr:hypothetical protein B0H19DRAFT_1268938 [Mycena capillaripes]
MLQVSAENAASCFILELLEKTIPGSQDDGLGLLYLTSALFLRLAHSSYAFIRLALVGLPDHARLRPPTEAVILQFLSPLSLINAMVSRPLSRLHLSVAREQPLANISNRDSLVRGCAYALLMGFVELVLPLNHKLELHAEAGNMPSHVRDRMRLLKVQTREMAGLVVRELDEAEAASVVEPERARDLQTIHGQLEMACYSIALFASQDIALLIERLDRYMENATLPVELFDPESMLTDPLLALDQAWLDTLTVIS